MSFLEQLQQLPPECLDHFFRDGKEASYTAGAWLPDSSHGFAGIRLIQEGSIQVFASMDDQRLPVSSYGMGEALGVRSFLKPESKPPVQWQAIEDCVVYELNAAEARNLLSDDPAAGPIREIFELAAHLRDLDILLAVHPLFQTLPEQARQTLFHHADPIALPPGKTLIQQNQANELLYFICHGGVDIISNGQVVAHRSAGDILGEVSTLGFAPTASVQSAGWSDVLAFNRNAILAACQENPEFAAKLASFGMSGFQ